MQRKINSEESLHNLAVRSLARPRSAFHRQHSHCGPSIGVEHLICLIGFCYFGCIEGNSCIGILSVTCVVATSLTIIAVVILPLPIIVLVEIASVIIWVIGHHRGVPEHDYEYKSQIRKLRLEPLGVNSRSFPLVYVYFIMSR